VAEVREWLLDLTENNGEALKRDMARSRVRHSQITACTLSRLAAIASSAPPFDLVIVDEAAKASVPEALIAVNCARRLALVGDHHQLLPFMEEGFCEHSAPSAEDEEYLRGLWNNSLFHRLWDLAPASRKAFLAVMRRSRRPIAECVSSCFYEGTLLPGRGHASPALKFPVSLMWVDSSLFHHRRVSGKTIENPGEADLVLQALHEVDKLRKGPISVGVIAFHRGQAALLNQKLKNSRLSFTPSVLTVDASQGGQWDVVILSLGRSWGSSGFVGNPNRLNVAISRAKELCVFVGSLRFAERDATPGSCLGAVAQFVTSGNDTGKQLCIPSSAGTIPSGFAHSSVRAH
jgi:superfamily I DNA and/or RNA helicase